MPLTVCTWNINSVRLREGLVLKLLQEEAPDVLCLQETKAPVEKLPSEVFDALGYTHRVARGDTGYNGVMILSRLPLEPLPHLDICDKGDARLGEQEAALVGFMRSVGREDVERGQVLCKPGSVKPHTKFEAEAYILTKEEGGRHTPFFTNYRPQFYFRTTDVTGTVELPEGTEMVMPGDNLKFKVALIAPIAMEEKLRFAIREGGRTVGAGVVSKIIE